MQKLHRVIRKPFLWREKLEIGQVEQEEEEGGFWCGVTSNTCGKVALARARATLAFLSSLECTRAIVTLDSSSRLLLEPEGSFAK